MALAKKMEDALNQQINAEFWSAYLYLSMSAYYDTLGLKGFANWMHIQFEEEQYHALKLFDYLQNRGGTVELKPIGEVPNKWDSALNAFEETLKHEQKVTQMINDLLETAKETKDNATQSFLKWFIDEQVEEEASVNEILDQLRLVNGKGNGLFMIDRELRSRKFTPPSE